jgi:hypothetical protein
MADADHDTPRRTTDPRGHIENRPIVHAVSAPGRLVAAATITLSALVGATACDDDRVDTSATTEVRPTVTAGGPLPVTATTSPRRPTADNPPVSPSPMVPVSTAPQAPPTPITATFIIVPDAIVQGALLEHDGCLYFETDTPARPVVLWPSGTVWDATTPGVVLPDGTTYIVGDLLRGGGGYRSLRRTIEQYPTTEQKLRACQPTAGDDDPGTVVIFVPLTP